MSCLHCGQANHPRAALNRRCSRREARAAWSFVPLFIVSCLHILRRPSILFGSFLTRPAYSWTSFLMSRSGKERQTRLRFMLNAVAAQKADRPRDCWLTLWWLPMPRFAPIDL